MFKIKTLNAISDVIYDQLDSNYIVGNDEENPDAVLVRSASMLEMDMPKELLSIARAGAGVNNIPLDKCSAKGICVFNTPGANANAVAELVIAGMLLSSRDVVGGIGWAKTLKGEGAQVGKLVEKGKAQFTGPELRGKTLGIIGLGAIGTLVANAATAMGMRVVGFDPQISVEHAWALSRSVGHANTIEEVLATSDYLTLHVPLNDKTRSMLAAASLAICKKGIRVLNFSRAELVDANSMLAAIASGQVAGYVTDFPTEEMLCQKNIICIPHLGASTPASPDRPDGTPS